MRASNAMLILLLAAAGCGAREERAAAASPCTTIVSAVERLACFDAAAGTPPAPVAAALAASSVAPAMPSPSAPAPAAPATAQVRTRGAANAAVPVPAITGLVRRNEASRQGDDHRFRLARDEDAQPGQPQVVISAPALGGGTQQPILVVSCLSNISRLQLLTARPLDGNQMRIRLLLDGRPLSAARPWQVLETGDIVDAGRGLVAIELLRQLGGAGARLQVESDHAPLDGLAFDATGLHEQIAQQREACHW